MSGRHRFLAVSPEAVERKRFLEEGQEPGVLGVEIWRFSCRPGFMTRPASCREVCVESRARSSSSSMGKVETASARGPSRGREYPAFLACLVMMVTVVVLLHTTCTSSGPAYSLLHFNSLVTRPASILSRLDVSAPAKERPLTLLIGTTAAALTDEDAQAHGSFTVDVANSSTQRALESSLETAKNVANGTVMHITPASADRDHNSRDLHLNDNPSKFHVEEIVTGSNGVFQAPRFSNAGPVFDELQACKQAISEATEDSADPSLHAILYKNMTAFSKSYELMEQVFKIYTYRDGRQPLVHSGPLTGIYASEGQFIARMESASQYLTDDPEQAHMFFLPYSVQQMVAHLYVPNSRSMLPLATFIKDYVDAVAERYPFWNRTQGADHFFVSCHDWGPATTRDHPTLRRNAVKVVCNADLSDGLFVLGKDASLPEVYIHNLKTTLQLGGPRYDERPYLAFFAGQMHGRVRPILLQHWKDKDPEMKIYEVLPKAVARNVSYVQHMKLSKYCICAMGYEVNSPRIVEAIYYDCVPVIVADNFVLPFSDVLNWDAFSVTVPESEIPDLKNVLSGISDGHYMSMQARLRKVRQHFVWHEAPEKYDVFNMILHSVWTSRLNRLEQIREVSGGL